jgi:type IV pilus assembly protein PilM
MFQFNQTDVIGVDIGTSAAKIVQLRKENNCWSVLAAAMAEISPTGKPSESNISKAVARCLRQSGIATRLAVCSVCGPQVAVRNFSFPANLQKDEVEGAVLLEASQVCPFNIDDCAVTYQLIPNGQDALRGVLVAATNKLVEKKRRCVESAALEPVLMDVDGLALLNCLIELAKSEAEHTVGVLNVGGTYANLAILGDDSMPFVRDIVYSSGDAQPGPEGEGEPPAQAWQDSYGKVADEVNDTLRYYTARVRKSAVEKVRSLESIPGDALLRRRELSASAPGKRTGASRSGRPGDEVNLICLR